MNNLLNENKATSVIIWDSIITENFLRLSTRHEIKIAINTQNTLIGAQIKLIQTIGLKYEVQPPDFSLNLRPTFSL